MENVNFILKFILSSYIKNLLEIVVKLKFKKSWPKYTVTLQNSALCIHAYVY